MNEHALRRALADLPLGEVRIYEQTGSSNDIALAWAAEGAPNLSLVYAEQQTSGRGRSRRRWLTVAGGGLAFSLILRPAARQRLSPAVFSALAALGVCSALEALEVPAEIKWPNDVLVRGRKVCGVLAEAVWLGDQLDSIVLGVGVNVTPASIPPGDGLTFPAACLEGESGRSLDRAVLLRSILGKILDWHRLEAGPAFWQAVQSRLAYRGESVVVSGEGLPAVEGQLQGLEPDGSLVLLAPGGVLHRIHFGELHLRPVV